MIAAHPGIPTSGEVLGIRAAHPYNNDQMLFPGDAAWIKGTEQRLMVIICIMQLLQ